ncbi:MAG: riboflavin kinase, partial [Clostridia bacterium]|nr:riboflavin kinase [Clostridia bacterium]
HDLYGHRMQVDFLAYLRPERRFDSLDALQEAIRRDAEAAEAYVHRNGRI